MTHLSVTKDELVLILATTIWFRDLLLGIVDVE